ncbi:tetratricopeptide repeat protein [Dactylosporangium cerinum]|uniref:Tetratricopeptide repeat protein n=1 Tax=Dactylosporangium cerinum TaxID=1434730 RepID=A0ABV9W309_9ACTN
MIDISAAQIFRNRTPEWLNYFAAQPVEAIDALFTNRFYHGPLSTVEPDSLLLDWVSAIRDPAFQSEVDAALAGWLRERWDRPGHAAQGVDLMWQRALRALANLDPVPAAGIQALGERFPQAGQRLGAMTRNRAHDPLGWFWAACSRVQPDDSFIERWLQLCDLVPGTPLFHGHWGLVGLRRLTGRTPEQSMELVMLGLHHYLVALERLVSERRLPRNDARLLAVNECRWVKRAYPVAGAWQGPWSDASLPDDARRWLAAGFGDRAGGSGRPAGRSQLDRATLGWAARARQLAQGLGRDRRALPGIHELLGEQREYTARTGNVYYLVRSLCQFSSKLANLRIHLVLATEWAEEARSVDPLNAHTWTTLIRCWQKRNVAEAAIGIGFEALDRFPDDAVVRNGLADVLKGAGRLGEAEAVYREGVERFPDNVVVRCGLAEVLKSAGRLGEAEAVYRETVQRFPDNMVVRGGLAEVLKSAGRLGEAEAVYRESVERFPDDVVVRNGLAEVLKSSKRLAEAEAVYRESVERFPDNAVVRCGLAEVLKTAGRLGEAEVVYRETVQRFPDNVVVWGGLAEVLKSSGRLGEAEAVYRESAERFPDDVVVRNGLAEVLKSSKRLAEAEAVYRESVERFPDNAVVRCGLAEVLRSAGRPVEAEVVYRETVQRFPNDVVARGGLAQVRRELAGAGQQAVTTEAVTAGGSDPVEPAASADQPPEPAAEAPSQETAVPDRVQAARASGGPAAPIAPPMPDLPAPSLRSTVRRALAAAGETRRERLEAALSTVEAAAAADGNDADALFATLELLVALDRVAEADVVLRSLPSYLRARPEFEAMRGKIALAALHEAGSAPFGSDVVESVVKPWEEAVRSSAELRFVPVVQRLRVSAVMVDGADLEHFRADATHAVREILQQSRARAAAPASDPTGSLRSWWLTGVQRALTGDASPDDATTEEFVAGARERSDVLDALEDELLSASRYRIAIR